MYKSKAKKVIKEMMPVRKHLTLGEAAAYISVSPNKLHEWVLREGLAVSALGNTKYVRVADLDNLIEKNTIING